MRSWQQLANRLAAQLSAAGVLRSAAWRRALVEVPRHEFVPAYYDSVGRMVTAADAGWLAGAWEDRALVVKRGPAGEVFSSASQPTVVFSMLERLRVRPGMSVWEIGTGTGYNAALLCHRLGAQAVTTVDIDAGLVMAARERLAALGYSPTVIAADASRPPAGPFDRIIATCAVSEVPPAWLEQLAPGGRLVAPVSSNQAPGALAVFDRSAGGGVHGQLVDAGVYFLPLRHA